jgi:hypothetical protein
MVTIYRARHFKRKTMKSKLYIASTALVICGISTYFLYQGTTASPAAATPATESSYLIPPSTTTTTAPRQISIPVENVRRTQSSRQANGSNRQIVKPTTTTSQVPQPLTSKQIATIQAGENQSGYDYCTATGQPQGCKTPESQGMADTTTTLNGTDADE